MSKRSGIMLCYPLEERRLNGWTKPYIIQPKLNGERCRAVYLNGEVTLYSSSCEIIVSVPHINAAIKEKMKKMHIPEVGFNLEFDGEIYRHGMTLEEIQSIVSRTVNLHPNYTEVGYNIFDLVIGLPQEDRLIALDKFWDDEPHQDLIDTLYEPRTIQTVHWIRGESYEDVLRVFESYVEEKLEGIVVRNPRAPYVRRRTPMMMKFKPKKFDAYKIIGATEEVSIHGVPKGTLGAIICAGSDGTPFKVGTGFTADDRRRLWLIRESLPGKWAVVKYQSLTGKNRVPGTAVYTEIVDTPPPDPDLMPVEDFVP